MKDYPAITILYEDNHLLVAVKPPNIPAQGDASQDADMLTILKDDIKRRYDKPGNVYLGLVHRMDRPVGGVMAFARTSKAAARLSEQLREGGMHRAYQAVVAGEASESGTLMDYLVKDTRTNIVRVAEPDHPGAKLAVLTYKRLALVYEAEPLSLIRVRLQTGRSHQIRVQFANRGLPLWGDARYGLLREGHSIALWGDELTLTHPTRGEVMRFTCKPPNVQPWVWFDKQQ